MDSNLYAKTEESDSSDASPKTKHSPTTLGEEVSGIEHVPSRGSSDGVGRRYRKLSTSSRRTNWFPYSKEGPPLSFTVNVNVLWWVVMAIAFVTRFWRIDFPNFVV